MKSWSQYASQPLDMLSPVGKIIWDVIVTQKISLGKYLSRCQILVEDAF
jgi:hypothetical protein